MRYTYYRPKYFKPHELCPSEAVAYWYKCCDGTMLRLIDILRERYGRISINNYAWGGSVKYAGFRPDGCTVGEKDSQHRYGRAFDLKFLDNPDIEEVIAFLLLECPEVKVIRKYSWGLHIDNRNTDLKEAVVWRARDAL